MKVRSALHRDARDLTLAQQVQNIIRRQSLAFNGVWYDPSDLSTLFQDAAGTIPVTEVGQPVGLILDKSGRGNHASQATTGYKPVLSAKINGFVASENLGDAAWTKYQVSLSSGFISPRGDATAYKVVPSAVNDLHGLIGGGSVPVVAGASYIFSVHLKAEGLTQARLTLPQALFGGATTQSGAFFDLSNGTVFSPDAGVSAKISAAGGGWYLCSISALAVASGNLTLSRILAAVNGSTGFLGDAAGGILVWGADVRATNITGCPAYQRVNTATDYDTVGFPRYLKFDGLDDFLVTGNVDFSASDKIAVAAGVRKLSDAAVGIVAEFSADVNTNAACWGLYCPESTAIVGRNEFRSKGTIQSSAQAVTLAPMTAVMSGLSKISADICTLRANSVQIASTPGDQGAGNFGNYPLYIGRRGGTSLPFNGRLYSLVICGGLDDIYKLKKIEQYIARKTGVII